MNMKLYNTMTRSVDEFIPITPGVVTLYTCGPTVYNYAHIGNLRTYVFEDCLKRALTHLGRYDVRHVMNVTDVGHLTDDADAGEDKMEKGAAREGKTVWEIAQYYWDAFREDMRRLDLIEPTIWCRATDEIDTQIEQVQQLEAAGVTYTTADGIYFDTHKISDYGKLARLDVEGLQAGHRVELAADKRNLTDFALWKFSPTDQQRLMEWDSPWGKGFPGWHIECSAMAIKHLGPRLDIHCGGIDHVNIHHTNEIAQAETALGHEWCNVWLHGEFLTMAKDDEGGGGKMSKSTGQFLTLQRLIDMGYDPIAYRYFLLGAHYRQQLTFRWDGLDAAATAIKNLKRAALELRKEYAGTESPLADRLAPFQQAVANDLNMPQALAAMWALVRNPGEAASGEIYATLLEMDKILGFDIAHWQEETLDVDPAEIEALLVERKQARADKNFARADEIRDQFAAMEIEIMDAAEGTTWRKK